MIPTKRKSNNPNGRPKGSKNKAAMPLKNLITMFLSNKYEEFESNYEKLEPEKKCKIYIDLIPYVVPKQREIDFNELNETDIDNLLSRLK